jgi:hypothetical protein
MDPVVRVDHNFIFKGPSPDIGDLTCYRDTGEVRSHWKPSGNEIALLAAGGHVALSCFVPLEVVIPPLAIEVVEAAPPPGQNAKVVHLDDRR